MSPEKPKVLLLENNSWECCLHHKTLEVKDHYTYFPALFLFHQLLHAQLSSLVTQSIKNLHAMQEMQVLISSLGRSPGGGNGNPLQYSCLGNSMDRGAWQATVDSPRVRHNLVTKHHFKDSDTLKNTFYTWYKIGL